MKILMFYMKVKKYTYSNCIISSIVTWILFTLEFIQIRVTKVSLKRTKTNIHRYQISGKLQLTTITNKQTEYNCKCIKLTEF